MVEKWVSRYEDVCAGIPFVGDCDDFMETCADACKAEEVDLNIMWRCFVKDENGKAHAVLNVNGWVLDNRYTFVYRSDRANYTWVKAMRCDQPKIWYECVDGHPPA